MQDEKIEALERRIRNLERYISLIESLNEHRNEWYAPHIGLEERVNKLEQKTTQFPALWERIKDFSDDVTRIMHLIQQLAKTAKECDLELQEKLEKLENVKFMMDPSVQVGDTVHMCYTKPYSNHKKESKKYYVNVYKREEDNYFILGFRTWESDAEARRKIEEEGRKYIKTIEFTLET